MCDFITRIKYIASFCIHDIHDVRYITFVVYLVLVYGCNFMLNDIVKKSASVSVLSFNYRDDDPFFYYKYLLPMRK